MSEMVISCRYRSGVVLTALLILLTSSLGACASVPLAGRQAETDAKAFRVDSARGRIYVVRPGNRFGHAAGVAIPVMIDGATIGANGNATFLYVDVLPGPHRVSSNTSESFASVDVDVEAGHVYFVDQAPKLGLLAPRVGLTLVEPAAGMRLVSQARLVSGALTRPDT
jgi:hypothetical protein